MHSPHSSSKIVKPQSSQSKPSQLKEDIKFDQNLSSFNSAIGDIPQMLSLEEDREAQALRSSKRLDEIRSVKETTPVPINRIFGSQGNGSIDESSSQSSQGRLGSVNNPYKMSNGYEISDDYNSNDELRYKNRKLKKGQERKWAQGQELDKALAKNDRQDSKQVFDYRPFTLDKKDSLFKDMPIKGRDSLGWNPSK